jgi:hypothetical protein
MHGALVDHQEVVPFVGGVTYDLGADIFVFEVYDRVFFVEDIDIGGIKRLGYPGMEFGHLFNQHPVCFSQGEILGNSAEYAVDRSGNCIGNRIE